MNSRSRWLLLVIVCAVPVLLRAQAEEVKSVTAPMTLDHNRMLVAADVQARDGSWRKARLWVDTGNPEFMMSEAFARALGFDVAAPQSTAGTPSRPIELPPIGVRLNGVSLDFRGVKATARVGARQWGTMHADANLPSTVLKRYQVVFDYPRRQLELGEPGRLAHRGERSSAHVHPQTGIVQVDAVIAGERYSFALDIGASYSFVSDGLLTRLSGQHPSWPVAKGAVGCANIWGLWPQEEAWPLLRVPEIRLGTTTVAGVGIVGLPNMFESGTGLDVWYSQKTARPVVGFLGPNAFKAFRVEIDYANRAVYFERGAADEVHDMDLVGLTLRPAGDRWQVLGAASQEGRPAVEGIEPGDLLLQVDDLSTSGVTMGTVVDRLRGRPGDLRVLILERQGKRIRVEARVRRFL